jgi:hypothetical protein
VEPRTTRLWAWTNDNACMLSTRPRTCLAEQGICWAQLRNQTSQLFTHRGNLIQGRGLGLLQQLLKLLIYPCCLHMKG